MDDLYSAYLKYAGSLNFKSECISYSDGHVVAKISGEGVWKAFEHESGKHVVQRVPPTENKGRRQTSIVSVGILPVKKEKVFEEINDDEIEIICQRGHGPGGQNVNKVSSAVRATHVPTGTTVFINGRDQGVNKRKALETLNVRVNDEKQAKADQQYNSHRKEVVGDGSRGDKVRTYNFIRGQVQDHRTGKTVNVKKIMKGGFQEFYE